jgi:polyphosphate kinase 2 (PPK2 family)
MLEALNLSAKLSKVAYARRMGDLQERLRLLQYVAQRAELPVVICLEGWDSAGKGRVIKKLMERLDPRLFRVHPGTAPTPLEQRYHFLWRYQVKLPNDGEMALFDHSWYGRVLVERCDRLVRKKLWREAYEQINQFERWLADDGQVLIKFWLHISKKEQKKRYKATLRDPLLRWKITKEYKRHHRQYDRWVEAVEEMLARTSSPHAPWTLVEAVDPRWARVRVFETIVKRIEQALARRQRLPAAISRTTAAATATQDARAARAARDRELAVEEERRTSEQEKKARRRPPRTAAPKRRKEVASHA